MAETLATCFLSHGGSSSVLRRKLSNLPLYPRLSHHLLPASCKMRHRSLSSQQRRQQGKKNIPVQLPKSAELQPHVTEDSDSNYSSLDGLSKLRQETISDDTADAIAAEHTDVKDSSSLPDHVISLLTDTNENEGLSSIHIQDLMGMIRTAEKNIRLLNQARIRALEDLQKIVSEKETLQGEINILEMRLAENNEQMRAKIQEKVHVELLEDQLEKSQTELSSGSRCHEAKHDVHKVVPLPQEKGNYALKKEPDVLTTEDILMKDDAPALMEQVSNAKERDKCVGMLEKEPSLLRSSLRASEGKLAVSPEGDPKLSNLKSECKTLWEKVEELQLLLDNATKQADQAILVLQQNQELRKKVERLEESLEESNAYKLSSERLHHYNELMQKKIKLLDERLEKSDEEIHSYVQLYQDSMKEFQDALDSLKEESKQKAVEKPVDDMPWELWSRILLLIDCWFLEKKILSDDAKLLRVLACKKDERILNAYMECEGKSEHEIIPSFLRLTASSTSPGLHVIHIAAEMAPVAKVLYFCGRELVSWSSKKEEVFSYAYMPHTKLMLLYYDRKSAIAIAHTLARRSWGYLEIDRHRIKVGGLGDVLSALCKALQRKGHLVEIVLPKYDCMQYEHVRNLRVLDLELESYFDGQLFKNKIWVGVVEGLPVYFIEPRHPANFFWRGQFYGEHDDFKRFSFFSRAALELIHQAGKKPDIIHCHDWQTAFVAPLYWDLYTPKGLNSARICFTCHNFEYQGTAPASELASCGLDVHHLNRPDRMQDNTSHDRINPVKGAIVFSNIVTTVSPTYAQEVQTPQEGKGLHATLNAYSKKFVGILNGIDTDSWNPATDTSLSFQYSADDLQGKAENKEALRRHIGLSSADIRRPLVGCITRLVPQKGVHLIRHAIYRSLELGGQFILLGSSPVPHIRREFEDIANQFKNHEHVRLILKYDESLSRLIYAASDMFIIPSIFEPCGLTQMIAMRYGAIPIARKTGGLNDSVFDIDDDAIPLQFRNGFMFVTPDEQGFSNALERAFNHYKSDGEGWQQLVRKVMNIDFSWDTSASQYEELYQKSVARARAASRT